MNKEGIRLNNNNTVIIIVIQDKQWAKLQKDK